MRPSKADAIPSLIGRVQRPVFEEERFWRLTALVLLMADPYWDSSCKVAAVTPMQGGKPKCRKRLTLVH